MSVQDICKILNQRLSTVVLADRGCCAGSASLHRQGRTQGAVTLTLLQKSPLTKYYYNDYINA